MHACVFDARARQVCIHMCIYMHVCTYIHAYIPACACMHVSTYMHLYTYIVRMLRMTHVCIFTVRVYVYYTCMHRVYINVNVNIHARISVKLYTQCLLISSIKELMHTLETELPCLVVPTSVFHGRKRRIIVNKMSSLKPGSRYQARDSGFQCTHIFRVRG